MIHKLVIKDNQRAASSYLPDLENFQHIKGMLSYEHPQVQLIAVIHNPLLIYSLSNMEYVHIIEMTNGYVGKVKTIINELIE